MTAEQLAKSVYRSSIDSFESIGRSIEALPGWTHVERFLDEPCLRDRADVGTALDLAVTWSLPTGRGPHELTHVVQHQDRLWPLHRGE
jgi:hypothetical protein